MAKKPSDDNTRAPAAPKGERVARAFGPGTLYPGVGRLVQRTAQPIYCGAIFGRAFGYTEHQNARDPKRTSRRFAGQFVAVKHDGAMDKATECYLPSVIESTVRAALDVQRGTQLAAPIEFSVEVWCEPAEGSPLGYGYACYDRKPQVENDPLLALGYASGLLERPALTDQRTTANDRSEVDPETGEVREAA